MATNGDDVLFGDSGDNDIDALNGNDMVFGGEGDDTLTGGFGNDMLNPGNGIDFLEGGFGNDTAFYSFDASGVFASLASGKGWHTSSTEAKDGDSYSGIENLWGTKHDDTLIGDSNANILKGSGGKDTMKGGGGADVLEGGTEADEIYGDKGNDTLYGQDGNDKIYGGEGGDKLYGGDGVDNLYGGAGADTIDGGADPDHVHYDDSTAGVTVKFNFSGAEGKGGYAEGDVITSVYGVIGSDFDDVIWGYDGSQGLTGLDGNDDLRGADGDDTIDAGKGTDTVKGGQGNDRIFGHAGADDIDGGSGIDTSYYSNSSAVVVDLQTGVSTGGYAEGDTLTGVEGLFGTHLDDTLRGDGEFNTLNGYYGNDTLVGRGNVDVLIGGAGRDTMNGGIGGDIYQYESHTETGVTAGTRDVILSFQQGLDSFDLSAIDAISGGGDDAFTFIGTDAFSGAAGELRYRQDGGKTFVSGDRDGDAAPDFSIRVDKLVDFLDTDFYL